MCFLGIRNRGNSLVLVLTTKFLVSVSQQPYVDQNWSWTSCGPHPVLMWRGVHRLGAKEVLTLRLDLTTYDIVIGIYIRCT